LRALRDEEAARITKLVAGTPFENAVLARISHARVQELPDGGMGSVKFYKRAAVELVNSTLRGHSWSRQRAIESTRE
jgi:hypothetical protein